MVPEYLREGCDDTTGRWFRLRFQEATVESLLDVVRRIHMLLEHADREAAKVINIHRTFKYAILR